MRFDYLRSDFVEHAMRVNYSNINSEMNNEERLFVNGLILENKPKKIIEIGVSCGGGTVNILNAIDNMPGSSLVSIDIATHYYANEAIAIGAEAYCTFPNASNWELYTGKDCSEVLPLIDEKFDFAIIDTAHLHPVESLNFLCLLPYLNNGAIVVLHDISLFYYNTSGRALATRILASTLAAEKLFTYKNTTNYISNDEKICNICAFEITDNLRKYIENTFLALSLPWECYPVECISSMRKCIYDNYPPKLLAIFDEAEKYNFSYFFTDSRTYSLQKVKMLIEQLEKDDVVFYGAGRNMALVLRAYELVGISFKHPIFDINANRIKTVNGNCVCEPNFNCASTQKVVITIANGTIAQSIKQKYIENEINAIRLADMVLKL